MVVNHANFNLMISDQPQLIAKITTILANRIWSIYKQLIKMHVKVTDSYDLSYKERLVL
jgi:hypothetical protein